MLWFFVCEDNLAGFYIEAISEDELKTWLDSTYFPRTGHPDSYTISKVEGEFKWDHQPVVGHCDRAAWLSKFTA